MRRFSAGLAPGKLKQGLLLGLLCALLVCGIKSFSFLDGLERGTSDTMFKRRGPRAPSPHVIILVADDATVARFGQWPLPRRVYADVVRDLHRAGAKTIAFDILFTRESATDAGGTKALVQACREAKNVVHAAVFTPEAGSANMVDSGTSGELPSRFTVSSRGAPSRNSITGSAARPQFLQNAAGLGHVNVFPEWDGVLRRIPHLIRYRGKAVYPSLAMAAAAHFLDVSPREISATRQGEGGEVRLAQRSIPLDSNGETVVNWIGENGTIPTFSFNQLFDGDLTPDMIKDHVVLIGVTAAGSYEHHATPFSPSQAAVELQANALDDILSNRLLHEAPSWSSILLLAVFSGLTGILVAGRSAKISALIVFLLCSALWLAGIMLLSVANFSLPVAAPILAAVLTGTAAIGQRQLSDALEVQRTVHGLRLAEERYALAERGANDGLWDWDLQSDSIYFSPRWKAILGYESDELGNTPAEWFSRVHPEDTSAVQSDLKLHLEDESSHFENEYRMLHKDGDYRWVLCRGMCVRDEGGKAIRMAGSLTDSTSRKMAELSLHYSAYHDALTGLPNRALFMDRLEHAIARAERNPQHLFAVIFFDIDAFKTINDSLGHAWGNQLLIAMARRLEHSLRASDTAARQGGDEFTLLLDDIANVDVAMRVIERLQRDMAEPFDLSGNKVFTTISIGIALSTTGYQRPEDVLRDADTAMYRAKALGAGRHQVFDVAMHEHAVTLLRLQTELRFAIERQEFLAYYQPIVSLETGTIAGFEALVRWQHPERGLVPPFEFIPVAEDTGLVIPIDRWVLGEACRQTVLWHEQFAQRYGSGQSPLTISVNLSSKQFAQSDLFTQIESIVRESRIDQKSLKLEITEGVLMQNADSAAALLLQLKSLGMQLSIDDFGTGYSSLSYLHRFPLDFLKIDRSFVSRLDATSKNVEIVRAIVTLARNLGLRVIAEGIETEDQLAHLRTLGCDYGQGYLFSKPVDNEGATALLEQNPQW